MPRAKPTFGYGYAENSPTISISSSVYELAENIETGELAPIIQLTREQAAELADGICEWLGIVLP